MTYDQFLERKKITVSSSGFSIDKEILNQQMFEWQKDITAWALKKGKSALFEDCGLGKTFQQLEYAKQVSKYTSGNVVVFAPLSVSYQTKLEGEKFGIDVNLIENQADIKPGINITNYEKLDKFDFSRFAGVVLDESSILKCHSSKTREAITKTFKNTPFRLECTATPAPNDFAEIGNHSEFLGVMTQSEMLATFFIHDGGDTAKWRLKGHAADKFWEWIASWACVLQKPSDLGYIQDGYDLPPLNIIQRTVKSNQLEDADGQMLMLPQIRQTLNERRQARRDSLADRVQEAAKIANSINEQVLIWCDLNSESELLAKKINDAVEVKGADSGEHKTAAMMGFSHGNVKCLVSKPSIAGWGMNWQNCHNMIFVGLSDSFEAYYQAVRRCWRFGQDKPVNAYLITSEAEGAVKANIERKQADAQRMTRELVKYTQKILEPQIKRTTRISEGYFATSSMEVPDWLRSEVG